MTSLECSTRNYELFGKTKI